MKEAKKDDRKSSSPYVSTYLTQAPRNFYAALLDRKRVSQMWAPSAKRAGSAARVQPPERGGEED